MLHKKQRRKQLQYSNSDNEGIRKANYLEIKDQLINRKIVCANELEAIVMNKTNLEDEKKTFCRCMSEWFRNTI